MTLDEAIKHCEEVAESHDRIAQIKAVTLEECKCAKEHRQLATWLTELKQLREQMNSSEKPNKWINKPQESEDEKVIRIKKGTLKVRTGRYVIYDVEWLKTHFNTTEAKLYGQPQPSERTEERTETHACDCISRKAVLDLVADYDLSMGQVVNGIHALPSVTPQPKAEQETCQPKTGHWITLKDEWGDINEAVCSCCDANGNHKWHYCPQCGAKMQEVQQ